VADVQNKTNTIDDLVKELSKNNNPSSPGPSSPSGPPPNLPGVKVGRPAADVDGALSNTLSPSPDSRRPAADVALRSERRDNSLVPSSLRPAADIDKSVKSQGPVSSPRPQPIQPKPPAGVSSPPAPPLFQQTTTSGAGRPLQEYKSSIRTMGEDITSIKAGQKPSGVDIPRQVTPEAPKASLPEIPKSEVLPSGPKTSASLGKTERVGSLPGLPKPPTLPSRPGSTAGLGQAGKTGPLSTPPTPPKPSGPFKAPEIQPSVTVPSEKKGLSTTLYLLIAGILVVGGFLYWFLALRVTEPEVVVSPTPTPTVTPTPVIRNLSDTFSGVPANFEVVSSESVSIDFKTFVDTLTVDNGEFLKINIVQDVDSTLVPLNWLDMFDMDLTIYPSGLKNNVVDSATLVYGLLEIFNEDGTIDFDAQDLKKTAFVARINDATGVATMMKDWELTIAEDLADYLLIADTSKESSVNFLDNTYRGVSIRYKNFPFPDTTVDYAIVSAAGQNYLVIAGSREAMFATIDALLEQ